MADSALDHCPKETRMRESASHLESARDEIVQGARNALFYFSEAGDFSFAKRDEAANNAIVDEIVTFAMQKLAEAHGHRLPSGIDHYFDFGDAG